MKSPRAFLVVAAFASLVVSLASGFAGADDRPNILWLTTEDMSPTLGCYGDTYAKTPHIDELAAESVKYSHAFATAPVCSPARSCLVTGCYATTLGTQRLRSEFPIPESMAGFPALLRQAGYYCTNNVKTDYNTSREAEIIAASWDESSAAAHWRNRADGQPFFCVFNDMTTHQSRTMVWPKSQFVDEVQSKLERHKIHDPQDAPVPPYYPDTPLVRETLARHYDCVSVMDNNVGRLLSQLEEDGLADNTIVFFYSDHGSGLPRHKRALLDTGMHVPLLIRFPEKYRGLAPVPPGQSTDRLVSFVDFAPTVLSLCGLKIPQYMQGTAFLGPAAGRPREFVFGARDRVDEVFDLARSVRDKRYLYIRNFMPHLSYHQASAWPDAGEIRRHLTEFASTHAADLTGPQRHYLGPTRPVEELYDTEADPWNLANLADSPEHRQQLRRMRRVMVSWIHRTRDAGFLPESMARIRSAGGTPYDLVRDKTRYALGEILEAAAGVGRGSTSQVACQQRLQHNDAAIRYWGAVGLAACNEISDAAKSQLEAALQDASPAVRIEAAGALLRSGPSKSSLRVLEDGLENGAPDVVLQAARTAELLGARARPLKPAMQEALAKAEKGGVVEMFIEFSARAFLAGVGP
jgi:arylsulfatase A-like enzyme